MKYKIIEYSRMKDPVTIAEYDYKWVAMIHYFFLWELNPFINRTHLRWSIEEED